MPDDYREDPMRLYIYLIMCLMVMGISCAEPEPKDYTKFNAADVHSILVIPVVNRTVEVTAPDYFLSTITIPLAEQGYYVFPVNMVKRLLEDDGLSDADLVHQADTSKLCNLFGADTVMYITIENWEAKYFVLSTEVNVNLSYVLKDCQTGEQLWSHQQAMSYAPSSSSSGNPVADLVAMAVTAAITKAAPNYIELAREANSYTFSYPGPGIPPGPYSEEYLSDIEEK